MSLVCALLLQGGAAISILMYMLADWLFFQILILIVLESLDALRAGFWLAGSAVKCSPFLLVAVRWMSLVWGSQVTNSYREENMYPSSNMVAGGGEAILCGINDTKTYTDLHMRCRFERQQSSSSHVHSLEPPSICRCVMWTRCTVRGPSWDTMIQFHRHR